MMPAWLPQDANTHQVAEWISEKYKNGNISPTKFYQEPERNTEYF